MKKLYLILGLSVFLAYGCALPSPPVVEMPQTMLQRATITPIAPKPMTLDAKAEAFIQKALLRNPDMAIVEARWREVAALARATESLQQPRVEASTEASRGLARLTFTGEAESISDRVKTQQIGIDFRWELDLFGRLSSTREAANQEQQAAKADLDAALVTLVNMLRSEIVRLRVAATSVEVAERILNDLRETITIELSARNVGLRSELDLGQLRSTYASREAELIGLRTEVGAARLRLRTLSDLPERDVDALRGSPGNCSAIPQIGEVPLTWLRVRRDVGAAEARLRASAAAAQTSHAALYPSIGLTGSISRQREAGTLLATIVTQSLQRSLAAGVVGTLFDGGQRRAEARAADARTAAAMASFQRTLLLAAEEVDGAIDRMQVIGAARLASNAALIEAKLGLERTELRLASGIDSRLNLLQTRREAAAYQLRALAYERDFCIASLDLNRALALREVP